MTTAREEIVAEIEQRRFELGLNLLRIYNVYRVVVGIALLVVFLQEVVPTRVGRLFPDTFFWVTLGYTFLNFAGALVIPLLPRRLFRRQASMVAITLFDITMLTWMMYLSGGVSSGLGTMLIISVAAGAILVATSRAGVFLAAAATIAVLYEELYLSFSAPAYHDDFFQAGVLGILYFAVAITIQSLSSRLRHTEITSLTRAAEVADLERINRSIVARMRTGIVVVDHNNAVRTINQSARSLLGLATRPDAEPVALPVPLIEHLDAWRADTTYRAAPFQVGQTTPEIRVNFSPVRPGDPESDVIIYIEDTTEVQQHAQQLKLAALGRLSASIAHEIRNPLGAVNHAAQLLTESQNLDKGDSRLIEIITNHCQRMNNVVENVLELSRRKPPSPVKLNLDAWLHDFVKQFQEASMDDADITIAVDPTETEIRVDPGQLTQAVTNLAQNGLRYSLEHAGRAAIVLEGGIDPTTDRPFLNVIDQGPGVPDDELSNLFEPFFTTARSGTGLGLYLTRELCEANQARITYHPAEAGGSCFRISFAHPDRITA